MLKPNRQSLLVAMAICSGVAQPAFSETKPAAKSPAVKQPAVSQQSTSSQNSTSHEAVGTAPTLGEVLDQEAQRGAQIQQDGNYQNGMAPGQTYGQGAPGADPNGQGFAPGSPQDNAYPPQGAGYAPNAYPPNGPQNSYPQNGYAPGYPGGGMRAGVNGLVNDLRNMVQNMVQVNPGSENVKVRVPFVNVDVNHGQPNVRVNAPFVKVDKTPDAPVSVNAPFVNMSPQNP